VQVDGAGVLASWSSTCRVSRFHEPSGTVRFWVDGSIVAHGITAQPLMRSYARLKGRVHRSDQFSSQGGSARAQRPVPVCVGRQTTERLGAKLKALIDPAVHQLGPQPRGSLTTVGRDGTIRPDSVQANRKVPLTENHLIEQLPSRSRQSLLPLCEPIELVLSEVLCEAGQVMQHVYFPIDGFISVVAEIDGHTGVEVGMVGREGVLGAPLVLGVRTSPLRALVQGSGSAWRIRSANFLVEIRRNVPLRKSLDRYLYVAIVQLASAVTCSRYHQIGPRLARWLLMSQDRAHADHFHVTHEFLACMLGVRRVGITVAAGELQRAGLIAYHRGEVQVLDRSGLEVAACSCYATDRHAYARLLR
jgi:CRP-like cAMP-binding protein